MQRCDVSLALRQPAVPARLIGREGQCAVDATHRLVFGDAQSCQIRGKVAASGLGSAQITQQRQRFFSNSNFGDYDVSSLGAA
jgi:hypothetical protein